MPELVHEFTYLADLDPPIFCGNGPGPYGQRAIVGVRGGTVEGDRVKGILLPGGADWALIGADGYLKIDVRIAIQTHDGAVIYGYYHGFLEVTPAIMSVIGGGPTPTEFEDQYLRTSPRLETGDERYAWVNNTLFVSEGRLLPGQVEYRVYRVT